MTSVAEKPDPLGALGFAKLSSTTHLYKPRTEAQKSSSDPGLIVVCSWAFANEKHIAKYLQWHQKIYPSSRLLLVQGDIHNMIWRPEAWQAPLFEAPILAIADYLSGVEAGKSKVLFHVFSNGGSHTATQLATFWARHATASLLSPQLPLNAIILDSCPGFPYGGASVEALTQGLPKDTLSRLLGTPIVYATVYTLGFLHELGFKELAVAKQWRVSIDTKGPFLREDIPRTYIFSETDRMISADDVRKHAGQAVEALEKIGVKDAEKQVRMEEFQGTAHVNHMLRNEERYWSVVRETWRRVGA